MSAPREKKPKDRSQMPSTATWATMPNEERRRPMITITLSPDGKAELDRMRGKMSRGAYIEQLLQDAKKAKKKA